MVVLNTCFRALELTRTSLGPQRQQGECNGLGVASDAPLFDASLVANPDPLSAAGSLHGKTAAVSVSPVKTKVQGPQGGCYGVGVASTALAHPFLVAQMWVQTCLVFHSIFGVELKRPDFAGLVCQNYGWTCMLESSRNPINSNNTRQWDFISGATK
ncbi:hypothetical protein B0H17DRAFT_1133309 [Mycena rosella]|uniref:Uncharacterized protein n=1 Tax=Mycena rosella TaxID=1033263 RepID=A0AAD7DHQ4_MYCRO|nr:hypothetical protein B0H17DRAFT_1133309 [Mycena rosella]